MDERLVAATAMARTVKRARGALIDAVRGALNNDRGSVLRSTHAQVFESLDPGGTRLTTLADRAQMSHQAMGELVAELVHHGYLERVSDPVDRRARLIRPTGRGRAELARAAAQLRVLHDRWQRELTGLTVAQVVQALDTLVRICEESALDPAQPRPE
jgi:DNA-binding MarR family transcriptional regulator